MIRLEKVTKSYPMRGTQVPILKGIDLTIKPGERVGVLGRNGAGKSTLIRLISGVEQPSSGLIDRQMSISWPLAFGGTFLGMLTGYDNFRFICRLYNVDPVTKVEFVEDFCELGRYFHEPLRTYSAGMRARLAFAVSMAVEFDCFLIDEIVAVGDARFQQKCDDELFVKRADRAFLVVSHHADFIRDHCNSATVLADGVLQKYSTIDHAYEAYNAHLAAGIERQVSFALGEVTIPEASASGSGATEVDRREAVMEEQIAGLAGFMVSAQEKGLDDDTLTAFIRAFTNDSLDLQTFLGVVDNLKLHNHVSVAAKFASLIAQMQSQTALYHVVVGDLRSIQGDDKLAIDAYRVATEVEPSSYWGHRNLGIALFNIGDYCEAMPHFEQALALGKDLAQNREIIRHIIDCQTYLELKISDDLADKVSVPGNELTEISCKYYDQHGILSVRIQGFCKPAIAPPTLTLLIGDRTHGPATQSYGSNSYRRYAELVGVRSFSAEFLVQLDERPAAMAVELRVDDKCLTRTETSSVIADGRDIPPQSNTTQSASELAIHAYAAHDYEMAVVYSSLALQSDQTIDDEEYVESLIALGRFHEAEHRLESVFNTPHPELLLDEAGARLFDIYCAEIARSRLTGWRDRVEKLIDARLALAPTESGGLTNRGHLLVHQGDLAAAIATYSTAAEAAKGRDVIHFARGISSARYADTNARPVLPDREGAGNAERLLHLISCDAKYFKRYGPAVVASSRANSGADRVALHVHIVDPDIEALDLAQDLHRRFDFRVTSEFFPFPDAPPSVRLAYYTSARFINAQALVEAYQAPVLITETDCLINWSWDEIRRWCQGIDFGSVQSALWNFVPWTKIPAGIIYFDNGPIGQSIAGDIRSFLMRVFANPEAYKTNLWTIDQVALWLAWEKYGKRVNTRHLPMTSMLRLATGDKTNILDAADG